jgi:hypothetical protein
LALPSAHAVGDTFVEVDRADGGLYSCEPKPLWYFVKYPGESAAFVFDTASIKSAYHMLAAFDDRAYSRRRSRDGRMKTSQQRQIRKSQVRVPKRYQRPIIRLDLG